MYNCFLTFLLMIIAEEEGGGRGGVARKLSFVHLTLIVILVYNCFLTFLLMITNDKALKPYFKRRETPGKRRKTAENGGKRGKLRPDRK